MYMFSCKTKRWKLDSKANRCVMLGYGAQQKGYCLFDLDHRKVIHSRDVVFDETTMPGLQKETTDKYVELKLEEEPTAEVVRLQLQKSVCMKKLHSMSC